MFGEVYQRQNLKQSIALEVRADERECSVRLSIGNGVRVDSFDTHVLATRFRAVRSADRNGSRTWRIVV